MGTNTSSSVIDSRVSQRIDEWKRKLIDLSRRNRLIYHRHTVSSTLIVARPEIQDIFDRLVVKGKKWAFWLPPAEMEGADGHPDLEELLSMKLQSDELLCKDVDLSRLERVLKNLYTRSRADYLERGVRILYICFGTLVWKEVETSDEVHSPLLLVPIELGRESAREPFYISLPPAEEEVVLNPALRVKLQHDFNIELPPIPEELDELRIQEYLDSVVKIGRNLGWSVEPTVLIGLFSFHKLVMYQDLSTNSSIISKHPLIRALAGEARRDLILDDLPDEKQLDNVQKPEKTFQVLDADSSQQLCIQYTLRGQSIVIQGPPGTGKSQTIANIIAESIASGSSVLFVSEKMAALEVVFKRLRAAGLGDFCLQLHSHKANKREVIAELNRSLNELVVPKKSLSAIEFEKLTQLRKRLNEYVQALHEKRVPLEISAYEVLSQIARLEEIPFYSAEFPEPKKLTPQRVQELEEMIFQLRTVWQVVEEGRAFPWNGCNISPFNLNTRAQISTLTEQTANAVTCLREVSSSYAMNIGLTEPSNLSDVEWLIKVSDLVARSPRPNPNWLSQADQPEILSEALNYQQICKIYHNKQDSLKRRYDDAFFDLQLGMSSEVEECLNRLMKYLSQAESKGQELMSLRKDLQRFATETQRLISEWLYDTTEVSRVMGFTINDPTLARMQQLAQLALLCCSNAKPEASWLDPDRVQELQNSIPSIRMEYEEYNSKMRRLMELYDENIFTIDLETLIERYGGMYKSILRWLRPSFYGDKKTIANTSHSKEVPSSVQKDLIDARRINQLGTKLDSEKGAINALLGRFFQGYNTDFDLVIRAIEIASNALKLASVAQVPESLINQISLGTIPSPELHVLGTRLQDSINRWNQEVKKLVTLIPVDRIPGPELPIDLSPISRVNEWARSIEKELTTLNDLTDKVVEVCHGEFPADHQELISDLTTGETLKSLESDISAESERLRKRFGERYSGLYTNWDDVLSALDWTREVVDLFGSRPFPPPFIELVCNRTNELPANHDLKEACKAATTFIESLEVQFEDPEPTYNGQPLRELTLDSLEDRLRQLYSRVDDLQTWIDFKTIRKHFEEAGMSGFLKRLIDRPPKVDQLVNAFRKAINHDWVNGIFEEDSRLGEFRGINHEQLIREFRDLDSKLVRLSAQRVISEANNRKPKGMLVQARDAEISILRREGAKKRRHMPIRVLFEEIPNLLIRLKPCLLMGPLSVSQFLPPGKLHFDLVIFDEASQICPEDATCAIYRGKQLVVAGDDKQLPPTAFFHESMAEEYDWDDVQGDDFNVFESILDEYVHIIPVKMLRWHYRSKHESLIAFSNNRFYHDQLVTFPSPLSKDETFGVKFVYVPDGIYDRGGKRNNLREAEIIADIVFEHFEHYPDKTLGVVAFSMAQAEAIEEEIERRRRDRPEFEVFFNEDRLQGFFVKNLENVQGDERDVMIFSVGYGYDQQKRLTMGFGPLNIPGGERRLNVAITRAKEKVILVSSIKASDMELSATSPPGVRNLYHYLDYAERGEIALELTRPMGGGEFESPLEEDVAGVIRRLGYDAVPQVGCSGYRIDLAVVDPAKPGRFILGVECDGATYHSAYTARDRDRLRQQVLESLGWHVHRIWSPDWVKRRNFEIERLRKAIESASQFRLEGSSGGTDPVPKAPQGSQNPGVEYQAVQFNDVLQIGIPYTVSKLKATFKPYVRVRISRYPYSSERKNEFHMSENRGEQSHLLAKLVKEEGPIHFEYAVQRLADAWGLKRTGSKIVKAVREAVLLCHRNGLLIVKGDFLWPPKLTNVPVRVPVSGVPASMRKLEYIPPEEIENAMIQIVHHSVGIGLESLVVETARVFGFYHTGENIRENLVEMYKKLLHKEKLACVNDIVTLPESKH